MSENSKNNEESIHPPLHAQNLQSETNVRTELEA